MSDAPKPMKPTSDSETRDQRRMATAENELRALVRDAFITRFGAHATIPDFDLTFEVRVSPEKGWTLHFSPPLADQLPAQFEGVEAQWNVFQPGRVYCFRCEDQSCEHAAPAAPMEVFSGYDQLGCPRWQELTQYMLDVRDERVERLYAEPPEVLARTESGAVLRDKQLSVFGKSSKTYALLGEVVAGYFRTKGPASKGGGERFAVTFQAVEVYDAVGKPALELNMLTGAAPPDEARTHITEHAPWVERARKQAAAGLKKKERTFFKARRRGGSPLEEIHGVLTQLAAAVQQGDRREKRTTQHAKERWEIRRPVHKAMADLRNARPEHIFRDLKTKAVIVRGNRGRCHAFNDDGEHITSFVIEDEAVRGRLRKNRWTPMDPNAMPRFLTDRLQLRNEATDK